jgi:hypothetical protein
MPHDEAQNELASGPMADEELAAYLSEHEHRAIGYYESEIASEQADALDRYYRRPYGDERPGRSQVVDATVAITVDNALAAILKPFVSSEETVVFEPRGPEDTDVAEQATEYVNYVLHNDNCGFQIFHDWFKDALLQKVGVVKAYWEDYSRKTVERLENIDAQQLQMIENEDCRIIGGPYGPDEETGMLFTVDVERIQRDGKLCIENVPPEEYRISPYARPGRIPPYEAHITRKSKSELIEMGFPRDVVMALSKSANTAITDSRAIARYADEEFSTTREDTVGTEANSLVDFNDEFVLIDYDGDGITELRRVMRSHNVILYNEQVDYSLFARLCPAPMPHKVYGLSLADQILDEQKIATALWRQTLDNLYLANNPRPVVQQAAERDDGSTIADLLQEAPGAIIRTKAAPLEDFSVSFVADKSFPMLSYVEQQAESRTGISKHGQGIDPDTLQKANQITATQSAITEEGRNSRGEMIARIFAETGVRDLFRLMLKILVNHQPRSRIIRLRSKWVEMDPRSWNSDMDVSISVGLGIGSKAQQMVTAQTVLSVMEALAASPFASLIGPDKAYNAVKRLFNAAGIKNVDDYLNEPQVDPQTGQVQQPQPPPDPKMVQAQAQLQLETFKAQMQGQMQTQKQQFDSQVMFARQQLDEQKAQHAAQLDSVKATMQAHLDTMRFQHEAQLAQQKHELAVANAERDHARKDKAAKDGGK